MLRLGFLLSLVCVIAGRVAADTVTLRPAADTTLFETFPDNNFGRYHLVVGTTAKQGARSRALIKFVPGTNIPPGAVINSVQLTMRVDKSPPRPETSTFDLFRMLVDWTEGTGGSGSQTKGSVAKANESTWNVRLSPSTPWSAPGAAAPVDFAETPSASTPLAGTSLIFASAAGLVADVQSWVDNPASNFGWIVITESEDLPSTARRFNSRETSTTSPVLAITFTAPVPQSSPPEITSQPKDLTVFPGENASFTVAASGTSPLSYKWAFNQADLPGETSATLVLTNVQPSNAGSYTATVSNGAGSKVSAPATLSVSTAPSIQSATVTGGVLNLSFAAQAGHNYLLEFVNSLPAANWQTLTNIAAPSVTTSVVVSDPLSSPQRIYRLEAVKAP